MFTNFSFKTILQEYVGKNDLQQIQVLVTVNREVKRLGLGIKVTAKQFKAGKVVGHPEASTLNMLIQQCEGRVNAIFVKAALSGSALTLASFCQQYENPMSKRMVATSLRSLIEELRPGVVTGTYLAYAQCLNKLEGFEAAVTFADLTPVWLQQWELWMMANGISANTISKHHKNFKMLLGQCVTRKIIYASPYDDYKVARVKGNKQALTREDVMKLSKLFHSGQLATSQREALRKFLFSCMTGIRFSDVVKATHSYISGNSLVLVPQKTERHKIQVSMPLGPNVLGLIDTRHGKLFRGATDAQRVNDYLKVIGPMAGVAVPFTFHYARHTFATLFLETGGKPEVLMDLMGLTKWDTMRVYIHIVEERKREALPAMDALVG